MSDGSSANKMSGEYVNGPGQELPQSCNGLFEPKHLDLDLGSVSVSVSVSISDKEMAMIPNCI